ncbi:MAG: hypothetical protein Alpg2KO_25330 [Alphaproteobacteria bacterium]
MAKPRLVVLDTPTENNVSRVVASGLARKLGTSERDPALCLDARPWDDETPDPEIWDRFYRQARRALAKGQDVVMVGDAITTAGLKYFEQLAEKSGAHLFGRRLCLDIPGRHGKDPEPDHPFDRHASSVYQDGAAAIDSLYAEISRNCPLSPGTLGRDDYPIRLHMLDVSTSDRRRELKPVLETALGNPLVIDTADMIRQIERREEIGHLPDQFKPDRIMRILQEMLEEKCITALREGQHVVVMGREVDDPKILDLMVHVLGATETQADLIRVVDDIETADTENPPNMRNVLWPNKAPDGEQAETLARHLATQWDPPRFEDLLKLPLVTDRRRPLPGNTI